MKRLLGIARIPATDLILATGVILLEAADTILMYRILRTLPFRPALGTATILPVRTAIIVLIAITAIMHPIAMRRRRLAPLIPSRRLQLLMLLT